MNNNEIVLDEININSFGGITPSSSVIIVFDDSYKGIVRLEGNQETGKTSALTAIEALVGKIYPEYYVNKDTKSVDGSFIFWRGGTKYRTKITTSGFKLEQYTNVAGKDKWIPTGEMKATIKRLLPSASSPEILTQIDGEMQIKWLKDLAGDSSDDTDLKTKEEAAYKKRTNVNADVAAHKRILLEKTGYFKSEAKDVIPTQDFQNALEAVKGIDLKEVKAIQEKVVKELKDKEDQVNKTKTVLQNLDAKIATKEQDIKDKEEEIERIMLVIEQKKKEIEEMNIKKNLGSDFLVQNAGLPTQLFEAESALKEIQKTEIDKDNIISLNTTYDTYKIVFDQANNLTNEIDNIREERLALVKNITPDIEGFEVRPGNLDQKSGLFYKGVNVSVLSESERYGLVIQILKHFNIKVLFIENITSFGSNAMEIIELFAKEGGFVFATMMNRALDKMSITFNLND